VKIANNNEIVLKSNRVTGELVYDLLKDDFEHVDESYLEKYIGQLRDRDNRFLPNQEDFYYISDYEYNVSDNYNGYDDVYYEDNEYYYDEYLDEEYIHESVASDPSHESLILRTTPKYVYYLTSQLTDLYRCDVCEKYFVIIIVFMNGGKRRESIKITIFVATVWKVGYISTISGISDIIRAKLHGL